MVPDEIPKADPAPPTKIVKCSDIPPTRSHACGSAPGQEGSGALWEPDQKGTFRGKIDYPQTTGMQGQYIPQLGGHRNQSPLEIQPAIST